MEEIWKDIENYEGLYQVSNFGRVKSLKKTVPHPTAKSGYWTLPEKLMTLIWNKRNKYFYVTLSKHDKKKNILVHRLVATAFCPRELGKDQVDHIDGNRRNNHSDNLRWCTGKENSNNPNTSWKGPANRVIPKGGAHPSARAVFNEDTGEYFPSIVEGAEAYGLSRTLVSYSVRTGNKGGGFHWRYA